MIKSPIDFSFLNAKHEGADILKKMLDIVFIFIVFTFISLLFIKLFTNSDLTDLKTLKIAQFIQSICFFIIPPFLLAFYWSKRPTEYLKLNKEPDFKSLLLVILFMVIVIPFINLLSFYNQQIELPQFLTPIEEMMKASENEINALTQKLLNVNSISELAVNILLISILPALGEELFFRGVIQKIISEWRNAIFANWIAAFIFSSIHFQFYGFFPRLLLGAFFGYLLWWSGSLWLPIIAHFTNNVIAVVFYYLKFNGVKVLDIDTIGTSDTLYIGVISGVLTIAGILLIKRNLKANYQPAP